MATESLTLVEHRSQLPRGLDAGHIAIDAAMSPDLAPEGVMRTIQMGGDVLLPYNYLGKNDLALPSVEVETYRGNPALLVPLYGTNDKLRNMYVTASKRRQERIDRMTYEMAVRMLDTTGAEGLHHMHDTNFPHTVFYNVKPGGLQVYMTRMGNVDTGRQKATPVLAVVGATASAKDELAFLNTVGGRRIKGRR